MNISNPSNPNTPLIEAISNGDLLRIKELISQGTNVNQFDDNDTFTPLMLAIAQKRADIVKILLEGGADLYASTYMEDTPLGLAASQGDLESVQLLLQAGADPDRGGIGSPLKKAVYNGYIDMVRILIETGANVNQADEGSTTPLMSAALTGDLNMTKILVKAGANVDATDDNGDTALTKAAWYCHQEVFDYLRTLTSCQEKREYAQRILYRAISRQKNLTTRIISGASRGDVGKIRKAIKDGANVNARHDDGRTVLIIAANAGSLEAVKLLLALGAEINAIDSKGDTALSVALKAGHPEIIQLLRDALSTED